MNFILQHPIVCSIFGVLGFLFVLLLITPKVGEPFNELDEIDREKEHRK